MWTMKSLVAYSLLRIIVKGESMIILVCQIPFFEKRFCFVDMVPDLNFTKEA